MAGGRDEIRRAAFEEAAAVVQRRSDTIRQAMLSMQYKGSEWLEATDQAELLDRVKSDIQALVWRGPEHVVSDLMDGFVQGRLQDDAEGPSQKVLDRIKEVLSWAVAYDVPVFGVFQADHNGITLPGACVRFSMPPNWDVSVLSMNFRVEPVLRISRWSAVNESFENVPWGDEAKARLLHLVGKGEG